MSLELRGLALRYPGFDLELSLEVAAGELVTLLGPSGCGKTTTLRLVAGFLAPDSGSVLIDGRDVTGFAPEERSVGIVFQDYALFPHMSVAQNVAYGPRMRRWPRPEVEARVEELLALVGLAGFGGRRVEQLSGGEQQRVALARALAPRPRLLLLDEPLSRSRPRPARRAAAGDPAHPAGPRHHDGLRHPRPGGGVGASRTAS